MASTLTCCQSLRIAAPPNPTGASLACFLGIPCIGGDYNAGHVSCRKQSIQAVAEAICKLSEYYPEFCKKNDIPI